MRSFATILLSLSLPLHAFAAHAINHAHRHDVALYPRGPNARMSWYDITVGLTACGGSYPASAFVVAMNAEQFGNVPGSSPWCGKTISISYKGKTAQATVVDKCMGCGYNGIDLTQGLFAFFTSLGDGIVYGSWSEGGGAPAEDAPTSSKPPPSPTSHYTPPTTTSHTTSSPPPSSTSTSTTSKTSSSVSSAAPTTSSQPTSSTHSSTQTSSSGVAVPSGSPSNEQDQATDVLLQAVLGLGNIVAASKS